MVSLLLDEAGRAVALGAKLGSGGEGDVYALAADASRVAKIFQVKARTHELHDKLRTMIRRPPPGAHDLVDGQPVLAWPQEILYEGRVSRGRFVGYLMRRVDLTRDFVPIYDILSAGRRRARGLELAFDKLVVLGARIAHVVRTLHRMGYAIGDLNDRNVFVSRRLTPLFLDTDSFEVPRTLGHYACRVGDRLYWPPELLSVDLKSFNGSRRSGDRYSLAVLLFQMFLDGMRPYQCRGSLVTDLETLDAKTRAGTFAWERPQRGRLEPPAGAVRYDTLPKPIRALFHDAFVRGHRHPRRRPSAEDWCRVLGRLLQDGFRACPSNALHRIPAKERGCAWCVDPNDPFRASVPRRGPSMPRPPVTARPVRRPASSRHRPRARPWSPWVRAPRRA